MSKVASSIFKFLGGGDKNAILKAQKIFQNCKNQTNNKYWYTKGLLKEDFRSKHTLIVYHVWMVHRRLIKEGEHGLDIQECLFDELWTDSTYRIRAAGISELSVNKRLTEVQNYSFQCCVELDEALTKPTKDEVVDNIGGSLWRQLYDRREDVHVDHVLKLADYIYDEHSSLQTLPVAPLFNGRIEWALNPWQRERKDFILNKLDNSNNDFSVLTDEEKKDYIELTNKKKSVWREEISPQGKTYYWNVETRQTTWQKPKAFDCSE